MEDDKEIKKTVDKAKESSERSDLSEADLEKVSAGFFVINKPPAKQNK